MKLRIALVVHGRFHAFDLARGLLERAHDVTVFTNYPKWAAARFGIPRNVVRSFWPHGVLARTTAKLQQRKLVQQPEAWLHPMFGGWAAGELAKERWDVIHPWSGVAEETLRSLAGLPTWRLLMRGSAHIRTQARLLEEEEHRTRVRQDRPSRWIIAREEREYELADKIAVLSTFAYDSFIDEGLPREKLTLLPLGARLEAFRPSPQVVEARRRRILSGEPLRVLYVGTVSYQKGLRDLAALVERVVGDAFRFRAVGPAGRETAPLVSRLREQVAFTPKQPQAELPAAYAWGDIFIFPTIQDGYGLVLAQAAASGLPLLATTNCAAPDFIREGETGWVVPIRSPDALAERLRWCDAHRPELAAMVDRVYARYQGRDWSDVAADFEAACLPHMRLRQRGNRARTGCRQKRTHASLQ
jgi:glycosyltransferase involved in cell wall biosynthesis